MVQVPKTMPNNIKARTSANVSLKGPTKNSATLTAHSRAVLIGFLEALSLKPSISSLPDSPLACFMVYLSTCTAADIYELSEALVNRFNPQMPELTVVKKNLSEHVETLHGSIQQILSI